MIQIPSPLADAIDAQDAAQKAVLEALRYGDDEARRRAIDELQRANAERARLIDEESHR